MKSVQDRPRHFLQAASYWVSFLLQKSGNPTSPLGNTRPECRMGSPSVVRHNPDFENPPEIRFAHRDPVLQAFSPHRPNPPPQRELVLETSIGRLEHAQSPTKRQKPGALAAPGFRRNVRQTVWWWVKSSANLSLLNSPRDRTGKLVSVSGDRQGFSTPIVSRKPNEPKLPFLKASNLLARTS